MMKEISFQRDKLHFIFRNPLYKFDKLTFEYKIVNLIENTENNGYYYNAIYNIYTKTIQLSTQIVIYKREYEFIKIPARFLNSINQWYYTEKEECERILKNQDETQKKNREQVLNFLLNWTCCN